MRHLPRVVKLSLLAVSCLLVIAFLVAAAWESRRLSMAYNRESRRIETIRNAHQSEIESLEKHTKSAATLYPNLNKSELNYYVEIRARDIKTREKLVGLLLRRETMYRTAASRLWPGYIPPPHEPLDEIGAKRGT